MDDHQAILEGRAVCKLMAPPNGGSLWDAAQQVKSMHSRIGESTRRCTSPTGRFRTSARTGTRSNDASAPIGSAPKFDVASR